MSVADVVMFWSRWVVSMFWMSLSIVLGGRFSHGWYCQYLVGVIGHSNNRACLCCAAQSLSACVFWLLFPASISLFPFNLPPPPKANDLVPHWKFSPLSVTQYLTIVHRVKVLEELPFKIQPSTLNNIWFGEASGESIQGKKTKQAWPLCFQTLEEFILEVLVFILKIFKDEIEKLFSYPFGKLHAAGSHCYSL